MCGRKDLSAGSCNLAPRWSRGDGVSMPGEDLLRQRLQFLFLTGRGSLPPPRAQLSVASEEDGQPWHRCARGHYPRSAVVLLHR